MDQNALAAALGKSSPWVSKYKARGMPVDSPEAALRWCSDNLRAKAPDKRQQPARTFRRDPAQEGGEDYQSARARREAADADIAEMKAAEMRGELVPAAAVRAEFAKALAAIRDGMLNLPGRMAPVLAAESEPRAVQAKLDAEIRAVLGKMAG